MFNEIAKSIAGAEKGTKTAMFHMQVLIHASELEDVDSKEFVRSVNMEESYITEFKKMLSLARLLEKNGIKLIQSE